MKILVTGGAGFIGSAFVRVAEEHGHTVTVFDKLTYAGLRENLDGTRARLIVGDVCEPSDVIAAILSAEPDSVVHMAADSHVDSSFLGRRQFIRTNAIGTDIVIEAALSQKVRRFLHVSTDEVFGSVPYGYRGEEGQLCPRNPYAASKAAAEMVVHGFREAAGYPVLMVRMSNCYGPRQNVEKLVPLTVARIMRGEPAEVHSDGKQTREWLHVHDAARGIFAALLAGTRGGTYNLPGDHEMSVMDVVRKIAKRMELYSPQIILKGDRPGGTDKRYGMLGLRARSELSWWPQINFLEGLNTTVDWYIAHPERLKLEHTHAEIERLRTESAR